MNSYNNKIKKSEAYATEIGYFSAIMTEAYLVINRAYWWMDSGDSVHIYSNGIIFSTYHPEISGDKLYMGNSSTFYLVEKGTITLK